MERSLQHIEVPSRNRVTPAGPPPGPTGGILLLGPDLKIRSVNQTILDLLGYDRSHLLGKPIAAVLGRPRRSEIRSLSELFAGTADVRTELALYAGDRSPVAVSFRCTTLLDAAGRPTVLCQVDPLATDPRPRPFDVYACLERILDPIRRSSPRPVRLDLDIAPNIPSSLRGEPAILRATLSPAIRKATRDLGRGRIVVGVRLENNLDLIKESSRILRLRFTTMRDTGGLETLEHSFTQAFQIPSARSTDAALLGLMRGKDAADPPRALSPRSLRILLVEADAADCARATRILETWGHRVDVASDGHRGVDLWESERFDLILIDVGAATDGGWLPETVRSRERGSGEHVPIIGMAGGGGRGEKRRSLLAGVDTAVGKPLVPGSLLQAIEEALDAAARGGGNSGTAGSMRRPLS